MTTFADQPHAEQACNKQRVEVSPTNLPISCPPPDSKVWNAHPRVYLPLADTGDIVCPYCGTEYILKTE